MGSIAIFLAQPNKCAPATFHSFSLIFGNSLEVNAISLSCTFGAFTTLLISGTRNVQKGVP